MKRIVSVVSFLALFFMLTTTSFAYSNEPIHWGFKKSTNHEPPFAGTLDAIANEYGAYYLGDTSKKDVYLTFDNGYENGYTKKVLDVLKKENVQATFFVTGHYLESEPELVKRMVKEGHFVGNHSWSHPDLTKVSDEKLKQELDSVSEKVEELTGQKGTVYLRPPRGIFSERTLALSKKYGYQTMFWSLAFVDWKIDQQKGWEYSYNNMMKQIHPGSILLLHTVSKDNADALEKAIQDLKKEGYRFKSLDDFMVDKELMHPYLFSL
nr:delta-lactam-biosynthetic de-N-acetylase [Bacillus kexueae]